MARTNGYTIINPDDVRGYRIVRPDGSTIPHVYPTIEAAKRQIDTLVEVDDMNEYPEGSDGA